MRSRASLFQFLAIELFSMKIEIFSQVFAFFKKRSKYPYLRLSFISILPLATSALFSLWPPLQFVRLSFRQGWWRRAEKWWSGVKHCGWMVFHYSHGQGPRTEKIPNRSKSKIPKLTIFSWNPIDGRSKKTGSGQRDQNSPHPINKTPKISSSSLSLLGKRSSHHNPCMIVSNFGLGFPSWIIRWTGINSNRSKTRFLKILIFVDTLIHGRSKKTR